jgi:N-acetylneuraminate lyase
MLASAPLHGLTAATHTPFHSDGSLNLTPIEAQCAHLLANDISTAFIGGSTGESASLSLQERLLLAERWTQVASGTPLRVVVHVGANCLHDAAALAAQAEELGASAISALAPSYFKPGSVDTLINVCAEIASAAPRTPFYYYEIPALTGIALNAADFLAQAGERIPNLAGIKFTNADLMTYQRCLWLGKYDIPWGYDEHFLGALAMGAKGAVGSGFNFAGKVYSRLMKAFTDGDLVTARLEQWRGVQLIQTLVKYGYMGAAKATMEMLGVPVGPARLPNTSLDTEAKRALQADLERLEFFAWVK